MANSENETGRVGGWLIMFSLPLMILLALSIRPANEPDQPFDYEISAGAEWAVSETDITFEREDGVHYFNYSTLTGNDIGGLWYFEWKTDIHSAKDINRQHLSILRSGKSFAVGGGLVASKYSVPVEPICELKYKFVSIGTDFNDVHIWRIDFSREFGNDEHIKPFFRGSFVSDNGQRVYKVKGGVKLVL